jgi:hypothetical protein
MQVVRAVVIDCHLDDACGYVADPFNDPAWCPKILSVEQLVGEEPGPGDELELVGSSTRLTQRDQARLDAPRMMHPLFRIGLRRDVGRQLGVLKQLLEQR